MFNEEESSQPRFDRPDNNLSKGTNDLTSFKINTTDIHTMPDKFRVVEKGGRDKRSISTILIILFIGAVLVAGAIFAFQKILNKNTNQNTSLAGNINIDENKNINANNNSNKNKNTNMAGNLNGNVNTNTSTNYNLNIFENTNYSNVNANTNLNVNTNLNTNLVVSKDTDQDGLTDLEESLFKTQNQLKDSDNDGYIDSQEVKSGYNPNGTGRIEATDLVKTYTSSQSNYSILYPTSWIESADPNNKDGIMFTSETAEFIEVTAYDNPSGLSARDWYISESPNVNTSLITTVSNWDNSLSNGVKSVDGLNVYYSYDGKIYVISYNINIQQETNYKAVFEVMYKSFKIISPLLTNLNSNTNRNTNINASTNLNANSGASLNVNF